MPFNKRVTYGRDGVQGGLEPAAFHYRHGHRDVGGDGCVPGRGVEQGKLTEEVARLEVAHVVTMAADCRRPHHEDVEVVACVSLADDLATCFERSRRGQIGDGAQLLFRARLEHRDLAQVHLKDRLVVAHDPPGSAASRAAS